METKKTIGSLIENEVRKQQLPINQFAKLINCQRANVYNLFKRNQIDIIQLKLISKVLKHNFFQDLADDPDLIEIMPETDEDIKRQLATSQFFDSVPKVLQRLKRDATIVFTQMNDCSDVPLPDFGLSDYFITFTIGETLKERVKNLFSPILLPIKTFSNEKGVEIDVCTNILYGSRDINIKLDYKTEDEWYETLKFAFEIYDSPEKFR